MGFLSDIFGLDTKSTTQVITTETVTLPTRTGDAIRADLAANTGYGGFSAVQVSAVYACARVIAEGLAQVPCHLQKRTATGGFVAATDHTLYRLLNRAPNDWMTSFELREWLGFRVALVGNAYTYVVRDKDGRAVELIPLADQAISISQEDKARAPVYRLNVTGTPLVGPENIWHLKGPLSDADHTIGADPRKVAARAIGLASDLETFGSQLFQNGSRPSGVLTTDQPMTAEMQVQLREMWSAQQAGIANAHKTAVLTNGLKFQGIQTSANDSQWIEARRYQVEEICRIMRVNPVMVMQAVNSAAYASVEQMFLSHVTHTLQPWFERFTQSAEVKLLTRQEQRDGYRVHLDTRNITLGSSLDRANYFNTMVTAGLMTQNECREREGLDKFSDPEADKLRPAANVFGQQTPPAS